MKFQSSVGRQQMTNADAATIPMMWNCIVTNINGNMLATNNNDSTGSNKKIRKIAKANNNRNAHRKSKNTRWMRTNCGVGYLLLTSVWVLLAYMAATVSAVAMPNENTTTTATKTKTATATVTGTARQYSQPWTTISGAMDTDESNFRPIIPHDLSPEYISRNVFTKSGHYRVFQPVESDLRMALAMQRRSYADEPETESVAPQSRNEQQNLKSAGPTTVATTVMPTVVTGATPSLLDSKTESKYVANVVQLNEIQVTSAQAEAQEAQQHQTNSADGAAVHNELKGLEDLLTEYVENFFSQGQYEPLPGLVLELQRNHSKHGSQQDGKLRRVVRQVMEDANVSVNVPRALQSGRLLFFTGLKKIMWPIYMGLQVLKSLLFALFLPTIIGSVSRLIGKGITSGSASSVPLFVRPMDTPQDLDFRDNNFGFEDDTKFMINAEDSNKDGFNQAASQTQAQYTAYNAAAVNQMALDRQHQQMMQDTYLSALQSIGAASFKNSQGISSGSSGALGGLGGLGGGAGVSKKPAAPANMNTFQTFQKVPTSSLLLSNYDPFYSPLLSRLDSVFAQLKLNSENEICREKLICLMYAHPTKYAPYSNLVSAQLSRELNELRKPTSDNPEILRFFKYMRAAKDGQDGIDCEQSFVKCKEFKDFENPAMLSTYNDINKLVQARKLA